MLVDGRSLVFDARLLLGVKFLENLDEGTLDRLSQDIGFLREKVFSLPKTAFLVPDVEGKSYELSLELFKASVTAAVFEDDNFFKKCVLGVASTFKLVFGESTGEFSKFEMRDDLLFSRDLTGDVNFFEKFLYSFLSELILGGFSTACDVKLNFLDLGHLPEIKSSPLMEFNFFSDLTNLSLLRTFFFLGVTSKTESSFSAEGD